MATTELTLDVLTDALHDERESDLAALRFRTRFEPAAGPGAKVYPPTYPITTDRGPYVFEQRYFKGEESTETVLLDSTGSQANRVEEALLDAVEGGRIELPLVILETTANGQTVRLTTLEMPHRSSDAYLRDAETEDGVPFDKTPEGTELRRATLRNATPVYRICPTALVLGTWDSHRGHPEVSFKAARIWVSELFGVAPQTGFRVGSRLDPLGMLGAVVKKTGESQHEWAFVEPTEEAEQASAERWSKVKVGENARLSTVGHGNVRPTVDRGGVVIASAHRAASLSLAGLRRLRFPINGDRSPDCDAAGRAVLAALALAGDRLAFGRADLSLRSGCDLVLLEERVELVERGGATTPLDLTTAQALSLFQSAVARAEELGLVWRKEPLKLRPGKNLQHALEASLLA